MPARPKPPPSKRAAAARKPGGRRVAMESAARYEAFGARERVERIVAILGNNLTAEVLHVSKSQPSLWRSGRARVSIEVAPLLHDLDYVMTRLRMTMHEKAIMSFLNGQNPFVNGRPIDVMILKGPKAIDIAIDAEIAGSYA